MHKLMRNFLRVSASTTVLGVMLPAVGHAQELETVVVTAEKQAQNAQSVSSTVTAISGDDNSRSWNRNRHCARSHADAARPATCAP